MFPQYRPHSPRGSTQPALPPARRSPTTARVNGNEHGRSVPSRAFEGVPAPNRISRARARPGVPSFEPPRPESIGRGIFLSASGFRQSRAGEIRRQSAATPLLGPALMPGRRAISTPLACGTPQRCMIELPAAIFVSYSGPNRRLSSGTSVKLHPHRPFDALCRKRPRRRPALLRLDRRCASRNGLLAASSG